MANFTRLPSGKWRAQIRRKGHSLSSSFPTKKDAEAWAHRVHTEIDAGKTPGRRNVQGIRTIAELVDLHVEDMKEVGKVIRRSKAYSLNLLKDRLGKVRFENLDRDRIIQFAKARSNEGAGRVTIGQDIGYLRTLLSHGAAVHGLPMTVEQVDLARVALKRLDMVGKGKERNRRPTQDEIDRLIEYFEQNARQFIPLAEIIRFAIATAMRQEEICRIEWKDLTPRTRTLVVKDRKDPQKKVGNDQAIPLLKVSGYDAWGIIEARRSAATANNARIFPFNSRSVGAAFRRACRELKIVDLHFHDLRHEGTSRLFEAGFTIEQAALVTGHKDWKMLKRYTHLRPEYLHKVAHAMSPRTCDLNEFDRIFAAG